jgi:hypothetical protein
VIDTREARNLLDTGAVGRLLSLVTPEEVGLAWCRYASRRVHGAKPPGWDSDPDGWAAELYYEPEFWADEEFVRSFLVTIADAAPEEALGWVGAGPLEDFITDDPDRLAWIEMEAKRSERFRTALANVWIKSHVSEATFLRIERAARVTLR